MKKGLQRLFICTVLSFLLIGYAFAQEVVTGKVIDAVTKEGLPGASVTIKGTAATGTTTGLDGSFKLEVPKGNATLVFAYIGFVNKEIQVSGAKVLGLVALNSSSSALTEVVITANPSQAIDRKTPIAVSTINQQQIEEKGGRAEFPELVKSTPGVMVSTVGGGYGDSRISIRGFSSNNVALLINGIPVNDVESGRIYWSNWSGLGDVAKTMQIQRGLGASTVAAPSLGGTQTINTFSTETVEGGSITQGIGSFNDFKTTLTYSTGLTKKGWASSFLLSRRTGDGNALGLAYEAYSYFFNLSKVLTPSQTLSFTFMGATQHHNQRYTRNLINVYRAATEKERYNSDYGYLNGQLFSPEVNKYSKPLFSINHDWKIDEKSSLATVAYGTIGSGSAQYITSISGGNISLVPGASNGVPRTGNAYSPIDFDAIVKANVANADGSSTVFIQNNANKHQQYGVLSSYKRQLTDDINILVGADFRGYQGEKYWDVENLLGGQYIINTADLNNPNQIIGVGGRYNNNYKVNIFSEGVYLQSEYDKDALTGFVALAINNTGNQRVDYFKYLSTDPKRKSEYVNFLGYQAKGGANYNLDAHNNVFANIGYLQRAPLVSNIFLNSKNDINKGAVPEKLLSYELGYGYRSAKFGANFNLYRSTYKDKSVSPRSVTNQDGTISSVNLVGLDELHQGIEVDAKYNLLKGVQITGQISLGDWHYTSDAGPAYVTNDNNSKTDSIPKLFIKNQKVSDAAQTTAALGLNIDVFPTVKLGADFNYYGNYNAYFDPAKIIKQNYEAWEIPSYNTVDLNLVYRFKIGGLNASFIANVYNLLGTRYISDAYDGGPFPTDPNNSSSYLTKTPTSQIGVFYGNVRTYNTSLKIKF